MRKIAVIGIGHVGSTVAYTLVNRQLCDQLVLLDKNRQLADAERNDLMDGAVGQTGHVAIISSNEQQLASCNVVIFAAGDISILQHSSDRFAELNYTKTVVEEWAPKLRNFAGIIINITNPCDVITQYLQELTGLPKTRVFGTGTTLDTARMQNGVAEKLQVNPNSVVGYVLGEHGNSQFVAWSTVRIASQSINAMLSQSELAAIEKSDQQSAWHTIQAKGYTSYGIANQAAICAEAVLKDAHQVLTVTNFAAEANCYAGHPAVVGAAGILKDFQLELPKAEQQKWQTSIGKIKSMYSTINQAAAN